MNPNDTVALRQESPRLLTEEIERLRAEVRALELKVSKRTAEVQRAREERDLLKELRVVNDMAIKRKVSHDKADPQGLKISLETLTELKRLTDELKVEEKKTAVLQVESNNLSRRIGEVEKVLEENSMRLATARRLTGWDGNLSSTKKCDGFQSESLTLKRTLTALQDEQKTQKETTDRITREIEELQKSVKQCEAIETEIAKAEGMLQEQNAEHGKLMEKMTSYQRLRKKKERMLNQSKGMDIYKTVRQLEGDKKVLHGSCLKLHDTNETNTKSIIALEGRLRQLEARLETINLFLKQVFSQAQDDQPMEDISTGTTEVPLLPFEDLSQELKLARENVSQCDSQLNSYDAKVEQLEKKIDVIQNAITSRTISSQLFTQRKGDEFETLISNVNCTNKNIGQEHYHRAKGNEELRKNIDMQ